MRQTGELIDGENAVSCTRGNNSRHLQIIKYPPINLPLTPMGKVTSSFNKLFGVQVWVLLSYSKIKQQKANKCLKIPTVTSLFMSWSEVITGRIWPFSYMNNVITMHKSLYIWFLKLCLSELCSVKVDENCIAEIN